VSSNDPAAPAAGAEGRGGALVVEGPAGIGKTVVLGAARHAAEGEGFPGVPGRAAQSWSASSPSVWCGSW